MGWYRNGLAPARVPAPQTRAQAAGLFACACVLVCVGVYKCVLCMNMGVRGCEFLTALPAPFVTLLTGRCSSVQSREHGVDRTPYKGDRARSPLWLRVEPIAHSHTRAISMNIVRATAWTLHDAAQKAKGRLCGKRAAAAPPRSADSAPESKCRARGSPVQLTVY